MEKKEKMLTCKQSDRDVPGLVCGYPLPCPYHTIIIDEKDVWFDQQDNEQGDLITVEDDKVEE